MSLFNLKHKLKECIDNNFRSRPVLEDGETPYVFRKRFSLSKLLWSIGPGFITVICFIDPGNIEANVQVGAATGFQLLWCIVVFTIVAYYLNCLSLKLGIYTQQSMAVISRGYYPKLPRIVLWLFLEIACIGVDIQELTGSAIALSILSNGKLPLYAGVLIMAMDVFVILLLDAFNSRILEASFLACLLVMVVTFEIIYNKANIDSKQVALGCITPYMDQQSVQYALGIAGSYVMPHNLFYQSWVVLTRKVDKQTTTEKRDQIRYYAIEQSFAVMVTLIINITLTSVFAATFRDTQTKFVGLSLAGRLIGDKFGRAYKIVFAIGLLASGQSASMTGTQAGQIIMEGLLNLKISKWMRALLTRSVALVPSLIVAMALQNVPGALDQLSQQINIIQAIFLPVAAIPLLDFTSNRQLMGDLVNTNFNVFCLGVIIFGLMAVNLYGVVAFFQEWLSKARWAWGLLLPIMLLYFAYLIYLFINPVRFTRIHNFVRVKIFGLQEVQGFDRSEYVAISQQLNRDSSLNLNQDRQEGNIQEQLQQQCSDKIPLNTEQSIEFTNINN